MLVNYIKCQHVAINAVRTKIIAVDSFEVFKKKKKTAVTTY